MKKSALRDGIRIEHLWALAVLVGIFVFVNTHPIQPYDFWFHIATGREIIQTGRIPQQDTFSYTAFGYPYPSNNIYWLAQIFLFGVYDTGGPAWVILISSLVITSAYGILISIGYLLTRSWRAAAAGALFAAALSIDNWNVRPQILAYLYASLCIWLIWSFQQNGRRPQLAFYPILMLFWVNSHGTFFIGMVLLVFWGLDEAWKVYALWRRHHQLRLNLLAPPLMIGLVSILACLVNPQGISIIQAITNVSSNRFIQNLIVEWQPPNFTGYSGILYLVLLTFSGLLLIYNRRQTTLFQVLCFLFFGVMGFRYVRAMIWFGFALSPTVAMGVSVFLNRFQRASGSLSTSRFFRLLNLAVLGLIVSLAVFSLPWFKQLWPVIPEKRGLLAYNTPIEATKFLLDANLPGPVFHDMGFGSYLTWSAVPRYRVFVDPRIELYPAEIWEDYLKLNTAPPDWQKLLEKYGIQTLMLYRKDQVLLIDAVEKSGSWVQQYQDPTAVIFTRR